MRTSNRRFKVKRLYIIGAGASRCASTIQKKAPLDKEFCEEITYLDISRPSWVMESQDIVCNRWSYPSLFEEMGLEDAVLRQISHFEFLDAIHPRRRLTSITGPEYVNHVAHLITFVLRRAKENSDKIYEQFTSKVFSTNEISTIQDRIITFNYDDLLDKYLINKYTIQEVYFDRMKRSRYDSYRRPERFEHPLIVKLHGSVNWRCSTSDFKRIIDSKYRVKSNDEYVDIWFSEKGQPSPNDNVSPFIIPPLPNKPITEFGIFRYLWTKAYEYLHEAEEIIICGYSLPTTDQLAYSMFSNFTNRSINRVTIVDPDASILGKWRELLDRDNIYIKEWAWISDFYDFVDMM